MPKATPPNEAAIWIPLIIDYIYVYIYNLSITQLLRLDRYIYIRFFLLNTLEPAFLNVSKRLVCTK